MTAGNHVVTPIITDIGEGLNWIHCLVQELEDQGIELPMGDYGLVYSILETARDRFTVSS